MQWVQIFRGGQTRRKKKHRNGRSCRIRPEKPVPRFPVSPVFPGQSPVAPKSPGRLQGCLMWRVLTLLDPVILTTRGGHPHLDPPGDEFTGDFFYRKQVNHTVGTNFDSYPWDVHTHTHTLSLSIYIYNYIIYYIYINIYIYEHVHIQYRCKKYFFYLSACVGGMSAHVHTLLIHVHTYTRLSKPSKGLQVCKCILYIMYLYIYTSKHLSYL